MNMQENSRRWTLAKLFHITIAMVAMATRTIAFTPSMQNSAVNVGSSRYLSATTRSPTVVMKISATSLIENQPKSFEDRMRDMIQGGRKKPVDEAANTKMPKNVMVVKTLEEYKHVVGGERDRIVVVRFFAPWCKACKAIAPLFYRMANSCPNVLFVEVPVTDTNANLHQGLQVPSLPYGHIYHPSGGLVEEVRIARKYFPQFAQKLQSYVNGYCEASEDFANPYIQVQDAAEEKEQARERRGVEL